MPADSTPNPQRFPNQPNDFWALNHPTAKRIALSDCLRNDQFASVSAQSCHGSSGPAYVFLIINGPGFSINSGNTPEVARAFAAALIAAADLCDAHEAEQCMAEERETARINAGPINAIELPGGVIAFEDASEVAA